MLGVRCEAHRTQNRLSGGASKVECSLIPAGRDLHPVLDKLLKRWKKHHCAAAPKPR